VTIAFAGFTQY